DAQLLGELAHADRALLANLLDDHHLAHPGEHSLLLTLSIGDHSRDCDRSHSNEQHHTTSSPGNLYTMQYPAAPLDRCPGDVRVFAPNRNRLDDGGACHGSSRVRTCSKLIVSRDAWRYPQCPTTSRRNQLRPTATTRS